MDNEKLLELAVNAKSYSYAPYSKFNVGAALLCKNGDVYTGCNVENASYSVCICAERTAIVKAISEGNSSYVKIAIVSNDNSFCTPCGVCRQTLHEFAPNIEIICANTMGEYKLFNLSELLPYGFSL